MKMLLCTLGLFKLRLVAFPQAVAATIVSTGGPFSCEPSPTQDLLPDVIAPMTGTSPAWLVDGHTMWRTRAGEDGLGIATILESVRISGRRMDGVGSATPVRGHDEPIHAMFVATTS